MEDGPADNRSARLAAGLLVAAAMERDEALLDHLAAVRPAAAARPRACVSGSGVRGANEKATAPQGRVSRGGRGGAGRSKAEPRSVQVWSPAACLPGNSTRRNPVGLLGPCWSVWSVCLSSDGRRIEKEGSGIHGREIGKPHACTHSIQTLHLFGLFSPRTPARTRSHARAWAAGTGATSSRAKVDVGMMRFAILMRSG